MALGRDVAPQSRAPHPIPTHNVRCGAPPGLNGAEKLGFRPRSQGPRTGADGGTTMRARAVVLAGAIGLAPLGVRAAPFRGNPTNLRNAAGSASASASKGASGERRHGSFAENSSVATA